MWVRWLPASRSLMSPWCQWLMHYLLNDWECSIVDGIFFKREMTIRGYDCSLSLTSWKKDTVLCSPMHNVFITWTAPYLWKINERCPHSLKAAEMFCRANVFNSIKKKNAIFRFLRDYKEMSNNQQYVVDGGKNPALCLHRLSRIVLGRIKLTKIVDMVECCSWYCFMPTCYEWVCDKKTGSNPAVPNIYDWTQIIHIPCAVLWEGSLGAVESTK